MVLAAVDLTIGREEYICFVLDIATQKVLWQSEKGKKCAESCMWGTDDVVYYLELDETSRPYRLWRTKWRNTELLDQPRDELLYEEPDTGFEITGLWGTEDRAFVVMETASQTQTETRIYSCLRNDAPEILVHPRTSNYEYTFSHHEAFPNRLFNELWQLHKGGAHPDATAPTPNSQTHRSVALLWHNGQNCNGQLDVCDMSTDWSVDTSPREWVQLVPSQNDFVLTDVDVWRTFILLSGRTLTFGGQAVLLLDFNSFTGQPTQLISVGNILRFIGVQPGSDQNSKTGQQQSELAEETGSTQLLDVGGLSVECINSEYTDECFHINLESLIVPQREIQVRRKDQYRASPTPSGSKKNKQKPEIIELSDDWEAELLLMDRPPRYAIQNYNSEVLCIPSRSDPTIQIPCVVAYKKSEFRGDSTNPCLVSVYGSYGECNDPEFETNRLALLDRGVVFAIAQVRGGGELGPAWRKGGSGPNRMNSFYDLIDVAKYLVDKGYCAAGRIVTCGGSAGGSVVCASMNLAPELFAGVVADVPFVDVLSTMLDPDQPLTAQEWEEWGNPITDHEAYHLIKSYSPTDTIAALPKDLVLPHVLIRAGWGDTRVPFYDPATLAATLREKWEQGSADAGKLLLFRCNMDAGHDGYGNDDDEDAEEAFETAFILHCFGISE